MGRLVAGTLVSWSLTAQVAGETEFLRVVECIRERSFADSRRWSLRFFSSLFLTVQRAGSVAAHQEAQRGTGRRERCIVTLRLHTETSTEVSQAAAAAWGGLLSKASAEPAARPPPEQSSAAHSRHAPPPWPARATARASSSAVPSSIPAKTCVRMHGHGWNPLHHTPAHP